MINILLLGLDTGPIVHINQKELAAQIGIARETIGKLERGDNQNPCYRLVYEVASYFGKPVEEIFQYEDAGE